MTFLWVLGLEKTQNRKVNAMSVKKDLRVKGYSLFTSWAIVSWKGGLYICIYIIHS